MAPLLLLLLAAAPVEARFLLTLGGEPWAELQVERAGAAYRYRATQFLPEGQAAVDRRFTLDAAGRARGLMPEVLALLTPPAEGCRAVLEERSSRPEQLCVDAVAGGRVDGRLDDLPFVARYREGHLEELTLPGARWERVQGGPAAPRQAPRGGAFAAGFPVRGTGPGLALAPPLPGVVEVLPAPSGREGLVDRARCLTLARAAARAERGKVVVTGLLVEGDRARPHAWVRMGDRREDPSRLPADPVGRYLELPPGQAGRVYLELLDGARAVVRTP